MRVALAAILLLTTTPALADPSAWCQTAADKEACLAYADQDDQECDQFSGEQYGNCRAQLLMMHKMTGTPPGDIEIKDCALPSGSVVAMNSKTCVAQGGTVR